MAQAALKYETEPQETLLIPEGGIATFLTATEGDWADEKDIPQNGIAQVTHIADRLAEYGRHEDEYMVHAAEGETVIPMAVLEANPHLRKNLFAQMEIMGLDPERYVVGSELNSINPVTGQPEFFLKKLFKGVKKLVKKVVKVVKKALPYVLPVALSFTPLGPVYGAALGSGIGTLMQGGDFKDALKAAVISGGIGGLSAGITGGVRAGPGQFGEGFTTGVKGAFGNVGERFGQALGGVPEGGKYWQNPLSATPRYPDATATPALTPPAVTPEVPVAPAQQGAGTRLVPDGRGNLVPQGAFQPSTAMSPADTTRPQLISSTKGPTGLDIKTFQGAPRDYNVTPRTVTPDLLSTTTDPSMLDTAKGWLGENISPGGRLDIYARDAANEYIRIATNGDPTLITPAIRQKAADAAALAKANMPILSQYGPSLAAAGLVGGAAGMFDQPEPEEDEDEDDPFKDHDPLAYQQYQIAFPTAPTYTMADIQVPGREVGFAQGGVASLEEFPRRSGAIAGPGTGRSDDVPAMLSDGEFVMTAKAVRGAGKGDRGNGMNNMYQMMRTFEANA